MLKTSHALVLLVVAVLALAGCATQGSTVGMQPVPITDFKMVAGKWAGPVTGITSRDDWAEMTITPEGRFDFGIARTIGVFEGGGPLTLADGKMQGKGARGSIVYTLYQSGNRRVLKGDATLSDGRQVNATLSPK
ncbi:MAG TPA: hypothetical protein VKN16_26415 [Methylomirabilota bacterium]|jgi:hypothetical protein|nr:hypothetical protein [Methylomirabilota bacterium]